MFLACLNASDYGEAFPGDGLVECLLSEQESVCNLKEELARMMPEQTK